MIDPASHKATQGAETLKMFEDSQLLRRYAEERSEEAFAELVRRRVGLVYAVALRQVGGDAHLAEDVTQRVFADLARKAGKLSQRAVLSGWLYRSAQFAASDLVRAERRRRAREEETLTMNEPFAAEAAVDWEKVRPVLDETLGELADEDRDAVALRFFENRPFAEIGRALSISEDTARKRVDRALDKLHALLARRGVTSTGAALAAALANQISGAVPTGLAASVTGAALTGATAGVVGFGGVLTIMSTSKMIAAMASLVAAAAIGVAFFQVRAVHRTAATLAAMTAERDAVRQRNIESEKIPATPSPMAVSPTVGAPTPAASARSAGAELDYVFDNPQARAAYLQSAALAIKARFNRFFRTAGLTGEQQDRLLRLVMDDVEGKLDLLEGERGAGAANLDGSSRDTALIDRLKAREAQRHADFTNGLRQVLGDQFGPAMQYLHGVSERNVADRLASQLYYTETPLTAEQSERLTQLLVENRYHPEGIPPGSNTVGGISVSRELFRNSTLQPALQVMPWLWEAPITDAAIARAASVITSPQLAALRLLQAQQAAEFQVVPLTSHPANDDGAK
jgi:RNA polymerase sigma factor (sigma-70 family)